MTFKEQLALLLVESEKAMWDGTWDKEDSYKPYTYVCNSVEGVSDELAALHMQCFSAARKHVERCIRANLDALGEGTIGGACWAMGIDGDERVQTVRLQFLQSIAEQMLEQDMEYPDNLTLDGIIQKSR